MVKSPCLRGLQGALTALMFAWMMPACPAWAGTPSGMLTVNDVLTLPHETARIEARLSGRLPPGEAGWAGILLQLEIDGKPIATTKTDGSGEAVFHYRPSMRGINVIAVSVVKTEGVEAEKAEATLCVWERRRPILLIELDALMQPSPTANDKEAILARPSAADAAEELSLLTQYYYNVVYVPTGGLVSASAGFPGTVRRWLNAHKFPAGFVMPVSSGDLHDAIASMRRDGWTTMKSGVGRSRSFAEALLHERMEVVVVPELPKGEVPRKAKMAKDWKEVRKKL